LGNIQSRERTLQRMKQVLQGLDEAEGEISVVGRVGGFIWKVTAAGLDPSPSAPGPSLQGVDFSLPAGELGPQDFDSPSAPPARIKMQRSKEAD